MDGIEFLGVSDAFHSGGHLSSSYLLELGSRTYLVDCGPTTPWALGQHGRQTPDLDGVFITHFHGDHYLGLPFLFLHHQAQHPDAGPLKVYGPAGLEDRSLRAYALGYAGSAERLLPGGHARIEALEPGEVRDLGGGNRVRAIPVAHQEESLGFRFEGADHVVAFTGDTEWCEGVLDLAHDADVLVTDCTYLDEAREGHLSLHTLLEHRNRIGARRIVLSHLGPRMVERSESLAFPPGMELARQGARLDL